MRNNIIKTIALSSAALGASSLALAGLAAAQPVPDTVKLFSGNNLGATSFFDGFGPQVPGFTFLDYSRFDNFTAINGSRGTESPNFDHPHIESLTNVIHLSYSSPLSVPGGLVGAEVLLPLVDLSGHADAPGQKFSANGFNIGDLTFGAVYQAFPVIAQGRPVLSWRAAIDVIAPTGGFKASDDANQTSGYWTLNPYVAVTALPFPKWEISGRLQYFHNLGTGRASNPPAIPGFKFEDGRAGDAVELNFAGSYALLHNVSFGINGYALTQIQDDTTNGSQVKDSRATMLYLGPGLAAKIDRKDTINFNVYCPIVTNNVSSGVQLNLQYIHPF
jgi:hypothetical protein